MTLPRTVAPTSRLADEIRTLLRPAVLLAVATTAVGFAGVAVVFTYLVPLLTQVSGISAAAVPLLGYGIGGFVGNLVAGRLADRYLTASLIGILLALVAVLVLFPFAATSTGPAVLALGLLSTAIIAPLQVLLLRHAGGAPTLAVAVNVAAFNVAIAAGAALGGWGVANGLLRWNGIGGAALAVRGLLLAGTALRRRPTPVPVVRTISAG